MQENLQREGLLHVPDREEASKEIMADQEMEAMSRTLREMLPRLSERQRKCLELRFWDGLSISEAAKQLGTSRNAIVIHTSRGIKRLRDLLSGEADASEGVSLRREASLPLRKIVQS